MSDLTPEALDALATTGQALREDGWEDTVEDAAAIRQVLDALPALIDAARRFRGAAVRAENANAASRIHRAERDALAAQVAAVEAVHYRRPWQSLGGQEFVTFGQTEFPDQCAAEGCREWPCPTIAALADPSSVTP